MMIKRYTVYAPKGCFTPQLRDTKSPTHDIKLVAPTLGGQWATSQGKDQAVKQDARTIVMEELNNIRDSSLKKGKEFRAKVQ